MQIRKNTDTILPIYGKIEIRNSPYLGIFHALSCWTFSVITKTNVKILVLSVRENCVLFNCAKIKGSKINHTKIQSARNLMGLRYTLLGKTKIIFWSTGKTAKKIGLVGWQNKDNIIGFLGRYFFENNQAQKKNRQFMICYNNDKFFLVLVVYASLLCFICFFLKEKKIID